MEISILAVGRLKSGPESELAARYMDRARKTGRALGFRGFDVKEIPEGRGARAAERVAQEQDSLLSALSKGGQIVSLDPGGELPGSQEFASRLARDVDAAVARTIFVIGGPDGLGEKLLAQAERRLSFGRLTWPHQIVRILLAEQLYRAMTILSGHPYHRA